MVLVRKITSLDIKDLIICTACISLAVEKSTGESYAGMYYCLEELDSLRSVDLQIDIVTFCGLS